MSEIKRPTSIVEAFRQMQGVETEMFTGIVTSVTPLTIKSENDAKLELKGSLLIVPRHLTDYKVDMEALGEFETEEGSITSSATSKLTFSGGAVNGPTKGGEGSHSHPDVSSSGSSHTHSLASLAVTSASASEVDKHTDIQAMQSQNVRFKFKMLVKNALKVGERVYLLSLNKGEKYYVVDREEKANG